MRHPLHDQVGKEFEMFFQNKTEFDLLLDPACGGDQNPPFFIGHKKSNKTEFTNVDILVAKEKQIKLICEIDESNVKPGHIFGKLLSLLSTDTCILKEDSRYTFCENLVFIQVLSNEKLKEHSRKEEQWGVIASSIKTNFRSFRNFKSIDYFILIGNNINGVDKDVLNKKLALVQ